MLQRRCHPSFCGPFPGYSRWTPRAILGGCPLVFNTLVMHPRFKKYRKVWQTSLNPRTIKKYRNLMEQERRHVKEYASTPSWFLPGWVIHSFSSPLPITHKLYGSTSQNRNAGAVILKVAYGWQVTSNNNYFVRSEEAFSMAGLSNSFPSVGLYVLWSSLPNILIPTLPVCPGSSAMHINAGPLPLIGQRAASLGQEADRLPSGIEGLSVF